MSDNDHTLECCFSRSTFADQVLRFSSLDCSPHDRIHVDVSCHLPTTTLFWKGCQICISRNVTRRAPFFHINVIRDRLAVHHAKLLGNFEIGYETFVDTTECAAPDKADEMVIIIGENYPISSLCRLQRTQSYTVPFLCGEVSSFLWKFCLRRRL